MMKIWAMIAAAATFLTGVSFVFAQAVDRTGGGGGGTGLGGGSGMGGGGGYGGRGGRGFGQRSYGGLQYLNGDPYGVEPDGRLYSWPRRPSDLSDRQGVPVWDYDPHFKGNIFTFARVNYYSSRYSDSWATDYPMADLNFSYRLQEQTAFKVNPYPVVVKFTDPDLFNYPFIYMVEVATLHFQDDDIAPLRRYLLNGGFLMVDDFWGEQAWDDTRGRPEVKPEDRHGLYNEMKRIFPDREPVDLDVSHPIFHTVFDLKEKPQVPGIMAWFRGHHQDDGVTWERPDAREVHYWAWFDDKQRMVALACHNTDLGDGWARELAVTKLLPLTPDQEAAFGTSLPKESDAYKYFHTFSEKQGYPMGVNILTYVMTH